MHVSLLLGHSLLFQLVHHIMREKSAISISTWDFPHFLSFFTMTISLITASFMYFYLSKTKRPDIAVIQLQACTVNILVLYFLLPTTSLDPQNTNLHLMFQVTSRNMTFHKGLTKLSYIKILSEAVEASQCYFFESRLMKHKFFYLLKPLGTIIQ